MKNSTSSNSRVPWKEKSPWPFAEARRWTGVQCPQLCSKLCMRLQAFSSWPGKWSDWTRHSPRFFSSKCLHLKNAVILIDQCHLNPSSTEQQFPDVVFQRCWVDKLKVKFYETILMNYNKIFSKGIKYKQLRWPLSCKVETDKFSLYVRDLKLKRGTIRKSIHKALQKAQRQHQAYNLKLKTPSHHCRCPIPGTLSSLSCIIPILFSTTG